MKNTFLAMLAISGLLAVQACNSNSPVLDETPPPAEGNDGEGYFEDPTDLTNAVESEKQKFVVDTLVTDLENPWGMVFLPNGDMLITERPGRIRLVRGGEMLDEPLGGVPEVYAQGQGGLLDIELHPNYEDNGWLYIAYSSPGEGGGNTAIMRAKLQDNSLVEQEVLFQALPYTSRGQHFGSRIEFDNDGYMFFSVGERGVMENAQDLGNHCGKIFRLHDDGRVPEDNPFVNEEGAQPEIYTYGNRNPQGMAKHPETGAIWSHEHGPRGGDEINIVKRGANYGWPKVTYGINYNGDIISEETTAPGIEPPIHYWDPSIAPCGMTFSTSDKYPAWKGDIFIGSLSFRYLNRCEIQGEEVVHEEKLLDGMGRIRAVEQGPDGYLYVAMESPGLLVRLFPVEDEG